MADTIVRPLSGCFVRLCDGDGKERLNCCGAEAKECVKTAVKAGWEVEELARMSPRGMVCSEVLAGRRRGRWQSFGEPQPDVDL